jgi:hypothetical protein
MTETKTATLLGVGPFNGLFSPTAFLFRLDPPLETSGHSLVHVVASGMEENEIHGCDAETIVFATDQHGMIDYAYYAEWGQILELAGMSHPAEAMHRLGYSTVIMDATASV